ncbi:AraC family transcriptional regulator [bacterium]|nr:MAG: AraC family transcriptional regulator [bacterium]
MPRSTKTPIELSEEIDQSDIGRSTSGARTEPHSIALEQVSGWHTGRYFNFDEKGKPFDETFPLVVRRELYRGFDENSYRHLNFWALYFVRRGNGTHVINDHAWSMARGNVYLLAPDSVHFYRGAADVVLDAIYFGETLFSLEEQQALSELSGATPLIASNAESENDEKANSAGLGHFLHLSPQRQIEVETIVSQIRGELARHERALHLSARSRLWCLIVQLALWRGENPTSTRGGESRELADVLHFCETHFSRPLTVEQLADITHFSRNHFTRLFTLEVGMAPATYLRHLRLQHAQKLLRETSHTAIDIARLCGFSNATAFSRAFQKSFDVSPLAYRKANKRTPKYRKKPQEG